MKKKNIGSSFDSWLRKEGIYKLATSSAVKRVLSRQAAETMKERSLSNNAGMKRSH